MQTVATPGLFVASESDKVKNGSYTFADKANLAAQDFTLKPASPYANATISSMALSFADIQALSHDDEARDTTKNFTGVTPFTVTSYDAEADTKFGTTTNASHVYYEDLYFQKSGEGDGAAVTIQTVGVQINSASTEIAKGLKVALVAKKPGTTASYELLGIWKAASGTDTNVWAGSTSNSTVEAYSGNYLDSEESVTTSIAVGNEAAGSGAQIRVYVYLDGEDAKVYSDNAATMTQLLTSLKVAVSTSDSVTYN
jgi:hypothetical protein